MMKFDEDYVEEGFQLAKGKFDRDGQGGREAVGMWFCSNSLIKGKQFIF